MKNQKLSSSFILLNRIKKVVTLFTVAYFLSRTYDRYRLVQLYNLLKKYDLEALLQKIQISENLFVKSYPPGHFYSPLPDIKLIKSQRGEIFQDDLGCRYMDLNDSVQVAIFTEVSKYYAEIPFSDSKSNGLRYYFNNTYFSYGDGVMLYAFLRHFKPRRVVEIGSGFSSALMLDVSEKFLNGVVEFTFIEPYPERLREISGRSPVNYELIEDFVQNADMSVFKCLEKGDILFIDSSHVGKIGSDVLYILFNILPEIKDGVIIHFHDIFWPFEYPEKWIEDGRAWNEIYLLRAFLACNRNYEILFFNSYFETRHANEIQSHMPLMFKKSADPCNFPNSSLWLRKLQNCD